MKVARLWFMRLAYELARPAGKRRRDIMLLPMAIYDRTDPVQTLHSVGLCANRNSPHASPPIGKLPIIRRIEHCFAKAAHGTPDHPRP